MGPSSVLAFGVLTVFLAGLTLVGGIEVLRAFPARRTGALMAVVVGCMVCAGVAAFVPAQSIPVAEITALHEGNTETNLHTLQGGDHAGSLYLAWSRRLAGDYPQLRGIVRNQIALTALNAGLFGAIAWIVLGRAWLALLAVAVFCRNNFSLHATFSETPSTWLATLTLAGVVSAAAFHFSSRRTVRATAILQMFLVLMLCALTREETAIVPGAALAVMLVRVRVGDARLDVMMASFKRRALILTRTPVTWLALFLLSQWWHWPIANHIGFQTGIVLHALLFADPIALTLPLKLGLYVPIGLVALVLLGAGYALVRGRAFGLLPLALLSLYRALMGAAHQGYAYYEIFRYFTELIPGLLVLALFSVPALESIAVRFRWPDGWRRIALGITLFGLAAPTWGPTESFPRDEHPDYRFQNDDFLSRDVQVEVRYLLTAVRAYPECEIFTRVTNLERPNGLARPSTTNLVLVSSPQRMSGFRVTPGELANDAQHQCVLFYEGLDCHLLGQAGCEAFTTRGVPVDAVTLSSRWYSEPREYGPHPQQLRFALYRMDAGALAAVAGETRLPH